MSSKQWGTGATDVRYTKGWDAKSDRTKELRREGDLIRCCCCNELHTWEDTETHHAYYLGDGDKPGLNLFPVCGNTQTPGTCHHWLHLKDQWHNDKADPIWSSGNYQEVVKDLQNNWAGRSAWGWNFGGNIDWKAWKEAALGAATLLGGIALFSSMSQQQPARSGLSGAAVEGQAVISAGPQYSGANLRSAPDNGPIVGELPNGAEVTLGKGKKGPWCEIAAVKGRPMAVGWAWCEYVAKKKG
jgi:hypothetical protein